MLEEQRKKEAMQRCTNVSHIFGVSASHILAYLLRTRVRGRKPFQSGARATSVGIHSLGWVEKNEIQNLKRPDIYFHVMTCCDSSHVKIFQKIKILVGGNRFENLNFRILASFRMVFQN